MKDEDDGILELDECDQNTCPRCQSQTCPASAMLVIYIYEEELKGSRGRNLRRV